MCPLLGAELTLNTGFWGLELTRDLAVCTALLPHHEHDPGIASISRPNSTKDVSFSRSCRPHSLLNHRT